MAYGPGDRPDGAKAKPFKPPAYKPPQNDNKSASDLGRAKQYKQGAPYKRTVRAVYNAQPPAQKRQILKQKPNTPERLTVQHEHAQRVMHAQAIEAGLAQPKPSTIASAMALGRLLQQNANAQPRVPFDIAHFGEPKPKTLLDKIENLPNAVGKAVGKAPGEALGLLGNLSMIHGDRLPGEHVPTVNEEILAADKQAQKVYGPVLGGVGKGLTALGSVKGPLDPSAKLNAEIQQAGGTGDLAGVQFKAAGGTLQGAAQGGLPALAKTAKQVPEALASLLVLPADIAFSGGLPILAGQGVGKGAKNVERIGKGFYDQYRNTYGPLLQGEKGYDQFVKNVKQNGYLQQALDVGVLGGLEFGTPIGRGLTKAARSSSTLRAAYEAASKRQLDETSGLRKLHLLLGRRKADPNVGGPIHERIANDEFLQRVDPQSGLVDSRHKLTPHENEAVKAVFAAGHAGKHFSGSVESAKAFAYRVAKENRSNIQSEFNRSRPQRKTGNFIRNIPKERRDVKRENTRNKHLYQSIKGAPEGEIPTIREPLDVLAHPGDVVHRGYGLGLGKPRSSEVRQSVAQEANVQSHVQRGEQARLTKSFKKLVRSLPKHQQAALQDAFEGLVGRGEKGAEHEQMRIERVEAFRKELAGKSGKESPISRINQHLSDELPVLKKLVADHKAGKDVFGEDLFRVARVLGDMKSATEKLQTSGASRVRVPFVDRKSGNVVGREDTVRRYMPGILEHQGRPVESAPRGGLEQVKPGVGRGAQVRTGGTETHEGTGLSLPIYHAIKKHLEVQKADLRGAKENFKVAKRRAEAVPILDRIARGTPVSALTPTEHATISEFVDVKALQTLEKQVRDAHMGRTVSERDAFAQLNEAEAALRAHARAHEVTHSETARAAFGAGEAGGRAEHPMAQARKRREARRQRKADKVLAQIQDHMARRDRLNEQADKTLADHKQVKFRLSDGFPQRGYVLGPEDNGAVRVYDPNGYWGVYTAFPESGHGAAGALRQLTPVEKATLKRLENAHDQRKQADAHYQKALDLQQNSEHLAAIVEHEVQPTAEALPSSAAAAIKQRTPVSHLPEDLANKVERQLLTVPEIRLKWHNREGGGYKRTVQIHGGTVHEVIHPLPKGGGYIVIRNGERILDAYHTVAQAKEAANADLKRFHVHEVLRSLPEHYALDMLADATERQSPLAKVLDEALGYHKETPALEKARADAAKLKEPLDELRGDALAAQHDIREIKDKYGSGVEGNKAMHAALNKLQDTYNKAAEGHTEVSREMARQAAAMIHVLDRQIGDLLEGVQKGKIQAYRDAKAAYEAANAKVDKITQDTLAAMKAGPPEAAAGRMEVRAEATRESPVEKIVADSQVPAHRQAWEKRADYSVARQQRRASRQKLLDLRDKVTEARKATDAAHTEARRTGEQSLASARQGVRAVANEQRGPLRDQLLGAAKEVRAQERRPGFNELAAEARKMNVGTNLKEPLEPMSSFILRMQREQMDLGIPTVLKETTGGPPALGGLRRATSASQRLYRERAGRLERQRESLQQHLEIIDGQINKKGSTEDVRAALRARRKLLVDQITKVRADEMQLQARNPPVLDKTIIAQAFRGNAPQYIPHLDRTAAKVEEYQSLAMRVPARAKTWGGWRQLTGNRIRDPQLILRSMVRDISNFHKTEFVTNVMERHSIGPDDMTQRQALDHAEQMGFATGSYVLVNAGAMVDRVLTRAMEDAQKQSAHDFDLEGVDTQGDTRLMEAMNRGVFDPGKTKHIPEESAAHAARIEALREELAGMAKDDPRREEMIKEISRNVQDMKSGDVSQRMAGQYHNSPGWKIMDIHAFREMRTQIKSSGTGARAWDILKGKSSRYLLLAGNFPWLASQLLANSIVAGATGVGPLSVIRFIKWQRRLNREKAMAWDHASALMGFEHHLATDLHVPHLKEHYSHNVTESFVQSFRAFEDWKNSGSLARRATLAPIRTALDASMIIDRSYANLLRGSLFYKSLRKDAEGKLKNFDSGVSSAYRMTPDVLKAMQRGNVEDVMNHMIDDRRLFEKHAQHVLDYMGDYSKMTSAERHYLSRFVMFYAYLRYSLKLTFWTMPTHHPIVSALLLQLGNLENHEIKQLLQTQDQLPFSLGNLYFRGPNGKLEEVRIANINPALNQLMPFHGFQSIVGSLPPYVAALMDQVYAQNSFTGNPWKVNSDTQPLSLRLFDDNGPTTGQRAGIFAAQLAGGVPALRILNKTLAQGRPQASNSFPALDVIPGVKGERNPAYKKPEILASEAKARKDYDSHKLLGSSFLGNYVANNMPAVPHDTNVDELVKRLAAAKAAKKKHPRSSSSSTIPLPRLPKLPSIP